VRPAPGLGEGDHDERYDDDREDDPRDHGTSLPAYDAVS
jgi:hypothetical protein